MKDNDITKNNRNQNTNIISNSNRNSNRNSNSNKNLQYDTMSLEMLFENYLNEVEWIASEVEVSSSPSPYYYVL